MSSPEVSPSQENVVSKVWNHFVPQDARLRDIIAYGSIDGALLGAGAISAYHFINHDPKLALMFAIAAPTMLVARIVVRRPTNLNGEPWQ